MTLNAFPRTATTRIALGTALVAAVLGCTAIAGSGPEAAPSAPLTCSVAVTESGPSLVIEGVVEARRALSGSYSLIVTGPGTHMTQGGPISAMAGETLRLGRVQMGGTATRGLQADLTVEVGGDTYHCPTDL
ncbi:hypothetical protein roselon_01267 [Roseibacterium elongatum DSM 19469]|uniref:CsgH-like domain-containing protein n=1 Tax=Roseicyclus elongatus DSM 19469 TaxID=1294273 RepID=W8S0I9_9RHOB|nr:curli-like amyloid fiber formation chaperone CsgH [Roseibacterium elongatum]AHM03657.1 hypothetical protein roselon_01267 [Roseibacterium elongatum DSM 19469]